MRKAHFIPLENFKVTFIIAGSYENHIKLLLHMCHFNIMK